MFDDNAIKGRKGEGDPGQGQEKSKGYGQHGFQQELADQLDAERPDGFPDAYFFGAFFRPGGIEVDKIGVGS